MSEETKKFEQQGYDSWIELWAQNECAPRATDCPARWMNDGEKRSAFIRGWNRAKREHEAN